MVTKYKEDLDLFNQGLQDKKKKDKKSASERPRLGDELLILA